MWPTEFEDGTVATNSVDGQRIHVDGARVDAPDRTSALNSATGETHPASNDMGFTPRSQEEGVSACFAGQPAQAPDMPAYLRTF